VTICTGPKAGASRGDDLGHAMVTLFLEAIGIPVYGAPGGWGDPDGNGVHGLNERRSVRSVFVGRDFLTDLIKVYADAK
jgi:hypothetical protein